MKCWGLWLCDSSDEIGSHKLNMAGMWPGVTKKLLKWKKPKKHTFSFKALFVHFLVKRLIFGYHQRGAFVATVNLIQVLQFVFYDLQNLLISMARSFKYLHNVELLYPSDEFQTLQIFNIFTCSYSIPLYMCPIQSWGLNLKM